MTVHVVSLPHTLLTKHYDWCAYTAKVRRLALMLSMSGQHAIVYGPDVHDEMPPGVDYVEVVDYLDRALWFGSPEWDRTQVFDHWSPDHVSWRGMNYAAATRIRERWQPGDVLGIIGGLCQKSIVDDLADLSPLVCEWGIGYSGVLNNSHKVFESYAWRHHVAGREYSDNVRYFDTVIPNCFDPSDFQFRDQPGDYVLFMGRPTQRKGLDIVREVAQRIDFPVVHAGQPGETIAGVEYVGIVTGSEKAELLANARCVMAPTTYLEPFGGVAVEAMMSGAPVVTTDWGAFTETVDQGVTGFRCSMLHEFVSAVEQAGRLNRSWVRDVSTARFSIEKGAQLYGRYLDRLATLHGEGWYAGAQPARQLEGARR